jgi:putative transposase
MTVSPHRRRYEIPGQARYLTFSCYRRLALFGNDLIKDTFVTHLAEVRARHGFRLIAWVVMPEHVHLLVVPRLPDAPVADLLRTLKQSFSQLVIPRWRELRAPILSRITDSFGVVRFWQRGGGYDRNVYADESLEEKIVYTHENPVRRGLVAQAIDWRWSSARCYAGERAGQLTIDCV